MYKYLILILTIHSLFGLNLKEECPNKIKRYPSAGKYILRFENYFDNYGCDLLPLYSTLDKIDKDYILDYIDENEKILPDLIQLSKKYPYFLKLLANNNDFIDFLRNIKEDKTIFKNVFYLLKFIPKSKIYQNQKYLKYIYFSAYDSNSPKDSYMTYLTLKKIPLQFMNALISSYFILKSQFPEIEKKEVIIDFEKLQYKLSNKELKLLCEYDPTYLITFLYNNKNIYNFKTYQKEMIYIYKQLFKKYSYDKNLILTLPFNISPYLMEKNIAFTPTFKEVMGDLINYNLLPNLLIKDKNGKINPCNTDNYFGIFSNDNLKRLINFADQEHKIYTKYIQNISNFKGNPKFKLFNIIQLSKLYYEYNTTSTWEMMKGILLSNLFDKFEFNNMVNKVDLILRLKSIGYFEILSNKIDWNYNVKTESEDKNSINAPKYLYILFTSVGSRNSISFLKLLLQNSQQAKKELKKLANYSVEDLSKHCFTNFEKIEYVLNKFDEYSIVIPGVGEGTKAITTGLKGLIKVGKVIVKKLGYNKMKKNSKKYFFAKGLKNSMQKSNETFMEKYKIKQKFNKLEEIDDKRTIFTQSFEFIGAKLFLKDVKFKQVCKEIK
jgi:hypothetical protein